MLNNIFRMKSKDVEVIPWYTADSVYYRGSSSRNTMHKSNLRIEARKTVFVGGLHGMMSSELLANMMTDLFGEVRYVVIDTDRTKYPIGSGRVCFALNDAYQKAVDAEFVEIKVIMIF